MQNPDFFRMRIRQLICQSFRSVGGTVIVNLPGSTGGVKDGLAVLDELLEHLVAQVAGGGDHE